MEKLHYAVKKKKHGIKNDKAKFFNYIIRIKKVDGRKNIEYFVCPCYSRVLLLCLYVRYLVQACIR